jgi:hypothetical protein
MQTSWLPALLLTGSLGVVGVGAWQVATGGNNDGSIGVKVLGEKEIAPAANDKDKSSSSDKDKKDYTISGSVSGLYPGASRPMNVLLSNPNNFPISVTLNPVSVGSGGSGCPGSNLRVDVPSTPVTVGTNGSTVVTLTVRMSNNPPNACKDAQFGLSYSGSAVKA